jgi:hypothetical protein
MTREDDQMLYHACQDRDWDGDYGIDGNMPSSLRYINTDFGIGDGVTCRSCIQNT